MTEAVDAIWTDQRERNDRLFDGPMLSVTDAVPDRNRIRTERTSFRYFLAKRALLAGDFTAAEYGLSDEQRALLLNRLRVLSSVTAVIAGEELLMGVRSASVSGPGTLSFPGSGYLDPSKDTTSDGTIVPTRELVLREIEEELGFSDGIDAIRCLGIFEDIVDGYHLNPALFSVVEVGRSRTELDTISETAADAWEFDRFLSVPLDAEFLERLLSELPNVPAHLLGTDRPCTLSPKACLMLHLASGHRFDRQWFDRVSRTVPIEITAP
ncbi:hypothetical protein ACFO5R_13015 [Halosolutus amylolyticus]|uniref:Nudix hydrolase domain-containing protein n=1 Tax=Halosolutus amylolyticus TaxID=2932267 RepID=A0ABD5PQV8_9EURY|nr:hypothetical protein [Halosolutus amylolyticus]